MVPDDFELCPGPAEATDGPLAGLAPKERTFVAALAETLCPARAAERAGYLKTSAWGILRRPKIAAAVREMFSDAGVSRESIIRWLSDAVFGGADVADYQPWFNGEKTLEELREDGIRTQLVTEASETPGEYGTRRRIKLVSPLEAIEKLSKLLGLVVDKHEVKATSDEADWLDGAAEGDLRRLAHAGRIEADR